MVGQAKAASQNLKKWFSKKKNELKRTIISYLLGELNLTWKRTPYRLVSFFYIKLLDAPFSSRLRNNSRTHFFLFILFFFFILNKITSCRNKMSFPSDSDMMSKELQNSDLTYVNLTTDFFKIVVKYPRKFIAKYCHLSPRGNRA